MIFDLFKRKRDPFVTNDIEDRVCRTLEFKLNINRHQFLTGGIPIVKKDSIFDYIEHIIEVHMNDIRTVNIHLSLIDTSGKIPYTISDIWTRVETSNCHEVGVYGICKSVKKTIRKKTCKQLMTLIGYLFMKNYMGEHNSALEAQTSISAKEGEKIFTVNIHDVKTFSQLDPEDRIDWLLSKNYSIGEIKEINRLYKDMKSIKESNHE